MSACPAFGTPLHSIFNNKAIAMDTYMDQIILFRIFIRYCVISIYNMNDVYVKSRAR